MADARGPLLALAALAMSWLPACDSVSKPHPAEPAPAPKVADTHTDEDEAHQVARPRLAQPTATNLRAGDRQRLTTLRVSAHVGAAIIRKSADGWSIGGPNGCKVEQARIERALDNLSALTAVSSDERPSDGRQFELQIVALMDQEPALHFDVADRSDGKDLVQLADESTFRVHGLDRELWSPDPLVWCRPAD
jgi:hypothetical protein